MIKAFIFLRLFSSIMALTFLVGMFQSCGLKPFGGKSPPQPSDPEFKPYVEEFEYYSNGDASHVPIYFANLPDTMAGVCHYYRIGNRSIVGGYIEIDRPYWETISELQKINLIFHELGHCVLGLDHVPWTNSVMTCPPSIMYDTMLSTQCMEDNYNAYIEELFPNWSAP